MNCFPTKTLAFNAQYTVQNYASVVKVSSKSKHAEMLRLQNTEHQNNTTFYYFPDDVFMQALENIGLRRDDHILHLMPIISYENG